MPVILYWLVAIALDRTALAGSLFSMSGDKVCGVNYFCLGAVCIFLGSVLLCALGFTIVLPYSATRDWPETECFVVNSTFNPRVCSCEQEPLSPQEDSCLGNYPCLVIAVAYRNLHSTLHNSTVVFGGLSLEDSIQEHLETTEDEMVDQAPSIGPDSPALWKRTATYMTSLASVLAQSTNVSSSRPNEPLMNATKEPFEIHGFNISRNPKQTDCCKADGDGGRPSQKDGTPSALEASSALMLSTEAARDASFAEQVTSGVEMSEWTTATMYRSWTDAFYKQCALQECGVEEWNIREVNRFQATHGVVGLTMPCYVDPAEPVTTISSRVDRTVMIHAVFWPCLFLFLGSGLWLGLCLGCWSLNTDPNSDQYSQV